MWAIMAKARRNPEATLAAFLALAAQIPHAQHVFFVWGHAQGFGGALNAWVYAIAVETATFFFVLRGWAWVSWGFASASIGVNVAYYSIAHAEEYGPGFMFNPELLPITWSMWLLSIILPVAVAAFAHATAGHVEPVKGSSVDWLKSMKGFFNREDKVEPVTQLPTKARKPFVPPTVKKSTKVEPVGEDELDLKDEAILDFLRSNGEGNKAELARAAGLTSGGIDRKKGSDRVGRMVKLERLGLVKNLGKTWVIVETPDLQVNGHAKPSDLEFTALEFEPEKLV